ncbi:MAG TPA: Flp family type IVb pilin [Micromonosporaceae bacterium]
MFELINRILARPERRDRGASAVEYALIVGLIVAGLVGLFATIGDSVTSRLNSACGKITFTKSGECVNP